MNECWNIEQEVVFVWFCEMFHERRMGEGAAKDERRVGGGIFLAWSVDVEGGCVEGMN